MATENRKEFEVTENGKTVVLTIRKPVYEDWSEADTVRAAKVSQLVRQKGNGKLLTRVELDDFLKVNGIWTDEDQKRVDQINKDIFAIIKKMKKGGLKLSEGRNLCTEVTKKRLEIIKLSEKRQVFDDSTIDALAEREKLDFLVYTCTVFSDSGKKFWESFEDMKNDRNSEAYAAANQEAIKVIFGYNPEFEKDLPENKWLKKFGFIDENWNYVDRKTGEKVDINGNPITEIARQVKEQLDGLTGDIEPEVPFIDDETNEPVVEQKLESKSETEVESEDKKEAEVQTQV